MSTTISSSVSPCTLCKVVDHGSIKGNCKRVISEPFLPFAGKTTSYLANGTASVYVAPGAHNEKQTERGRSAKRPRSRLKFQILPTVVELLNLEGEYIRYSTWQVGRPAWPRSRGRRRMAPFQRLLSLQRGGLIEDLEK